MDDPLAVPLDAALATMLDGNAVGGLLAELFGADMTAVPSQCAHCGTVAEVGTTHAWTDGPGVILRCASCDGIVLRIVETPDAHYLDVRGAAYLRLPR